MKVHGDGYKDLMEEDGTYGALGVLWGLFVGWGSSGGGMGKKDSLYVWVETWE